MRKKGSEGEVKAAEYLQACGFQILERNWRCKMGEIDLIASHNGVLVFVEVKLRAREGYGLPAESVHAAKQRKIRQVAELYLTRKPHDGEIRFDVIALLGPQIEHFVSAF